jgi:hypothetical protein
MTQKLILYLNGKPFEKIDIQIPEYEGLNFEERCKARCEYVDVKKAELRLMFLRQIIKCQFEYFIELVIYSSMGKASFFN